ncbi:transcription factor 24-like [Xyrauchen texanus]|uniref:transcription factor 24-like n=1 Tax=Xyrauchen texanus TaxID=154827 RepID=UPI002242A2D4|nr:transcription factor 24-like [Xyrauchen texanus]
MLISGIFLNALKNVNEFFNSVHCLIVTYKEVGRQTIHMDGNGSVTVMDDSPASSPNSSPSPDTLSADSSLSRSRVVPSSGLGGRGRPAAANAARERSRVQTLRHAFLELQRTLPSVPPDTKLSKLDVLILATTYIAHLTRTLQEEGMEEGENTKQTEALNSLKGDGYLHPVKKWPMRSRLYIGASGQFLGNSNENQGASSSSSQI